nr:hypothetical protein [Candidatus Sigynarchaeota archaeon]
MKQLLSDLFKAYNGKAFAMGVMPVRGEKGFRRLDYDYCASGLNVKEIVARCKDARMNAVGVVIKDTDGATV